VPAWSEQPDHCERLLGCPRACARKNPCPILRARLKFHARPLRASCDVPDTRPERGFAPLCREAVLLRGFTLSLWSLYSIESTRACQLASTTLLDSPTVPHRRWPSVDSINTRTRAPVPAPVPRTRTL